MREINLLIKRIFLYFFIIISFWSIISSCSIAYEEYPKTTKTNEGEHHKKEHVSITTNNNIYEFIIEPYLIFTGNTTEIIIQWQLSYPILCTVEWGTDESYSIGNVTISENTIDNFYSYKITGLSPLTKYYYRVKININDITNTENYTGTFYTENLSNNNKNVNFFIFGDTQGNNLDIENIIMQSIINTYTSDPSYQTFMINTGDLVDDGNDINSWMHDLFSKDNLPSLQIAMKNIFLITCRSNHDINAFMLRKYFTYPYINDSFGCYWSFDYGPIHVAVIDQYMDYSILSNQYNWLDNDLKSTTKKWKFILLHEPGWSAGKHGNNDDVQDFIQPLCVKYGVSLVLNGHNHNYARALVNDVYHLTIGSSGASLYGVNIEESNIITATSDYHFCKVEITDNSLTFKAISHDGAEIDSFTIIK